MSEEERRAYQLTIEILREDNTQLKELVTAQQEQIRHLLAKK
jgi:FtsZ-binding cell division protein ZapB